MAGRRPLEPGRLNQRIADMRHYTLRRNDVNDAERRALALKRKPLVDGRLGNPIKFGLGPYPPFMEALAAIATEMSCHSYTSATGLPQLVDLLAEGNVEFGTKGYRIDPERVFVGAGISGIARSVFDVLIDPFGRDSVAIPEWSYIVYPAEAARTGARVLNIRLCSDGQVDLEDLQANIRKNTKAVIVTTVGNPLGIAMDPLAFHAITEIVDAGQRKYRHAIYLFVDGIYEDFRTPGAPLDPIALAIDGQAECPIIGMYSISKMIAAPGDRLGWMRIYHDGKNHAGEVADFAEALARVFQPPLGQSATPQQEAMKMVFAGLSDPEKARHYMEFRKHRREECIGRMRRFLEEISKIPELAFPKFYIGDDGRVDPTRLHSFYVLFGISKMLRQRGALSLARELADFCIDNPPHPVLLGTPGDSFLETSLRNDPQEYMRVVALFDDKSGKIAVEVLDRFAESYRKAA